MAKSLGVLAVGAVLAGLPGQAGAEDFSTRIGRADSTEQVADDGLQAGSYGSAELGFQVEWDDRVWTASDPEEAPGDGALLISELSQGIIIGFEKNRPTMRACVEASAEGIAQTPIYSDFGVAPARYERPELPDGAAGELYVAEVERSGEEIAFYVECREVEETDTIVFMTFGTMLDSYDRELPEWQAIFDSIETVDE